MEKKTLGSSIAVLRKAKGLTQKQLAEMLNVSDKAVSRWERDECAPDLSVLPVLADIFDITVDELLRGQRKQPKEPVTKYETQKSETQLRYLLRKKKTDFSICSIGAVAVASFGLVAAMIGNLGFLRAYIGFFASCFFFIPAILFQTITLVTGLQSLDAEDHNNETEGIRRTMILMTEASIGITLCLFAACLPLITLVSDTYAGLYADSWACYGLLYGVFAAVGCLITCLWINKRLGYQAFPSLSTPKNKLRIRCALILTGVLLVTAVVHAIFSGFQYGNLSQLTAATKWETWEDLKAYLETPMRDDGEELEYVSTRNTGYVDINTYIAPDGTYIDITERSTVLVYEQDMKTPKYACVMRNQSINRFYFTNTDDHLPIYTLNASQLVRAENNFLYINLALSSVYIIEVIVGVVLYRRRRKQMESA